MRQDSPDQISQEPAGGVELPFGDAARDLVYRRLARQVRYFPELAIAGLDEDRAIGGPMDVRDAALAHAIYDAAVRRWLTLEHILGRCLTRPLVEVEPRVRAVLLAGAAQMLLLDRVPPHAVINHAVEWAKQRVRPGAGAMVNAVLRKVAGLRGRKRDRYSDQLDELPLADGTALGLTEAVMPEDELDRTAVATSHPADLLRAWETEVGLREARRVAMHGLVAAPVVLNTAHAKKGSEAGAPPLAALTERGALAAHSAPGHHVFTGTRAELVGLLCERPDVWVQDPAASRAVESVAGLKGVRVVVDVCAGQGTKTRQLAATFPEAEIVATDIDAVRRKTLAGVFAGDARVRVMTPEAVKRDCLERADLVLLDVPCSNTGVLARRPEAKYRFGDKAIESLANAQRQIIADSIPLLRIGPGGRGRILYSTCSLERRENQEMAAWGARWHDFAAEREEMRLPRGVPGEVGTEYADGAYSVVMTAR